MIDAVKILLLGFCFLSYNFVVHTIPLGAAGLRKFRSHSHHIQYNTYGFDYNISAIEEKYFNEAIVDHFAPNREERKWRQRYFINEEHWGGNGFPIFLFIGGEGPIDATAISHKNYIFHEARKHRALLLAVEHRFYGKSYPTEDMRLQNLRYLSSDQALFDLARFSRFTTKSLHAHDSKWIAFGGSYPGCLAAWYKLKFPNLVVGSIASSAPILPKINFYEYMEVVGTGLSYFGGRSCYKAVERAMEELHRLIISGTEGMKRLEELFEPCYPIENEYDASVFESTIAEWFQDVSQYNAQIPGSTTLTEVCYNFTKGRNEMDQLVAFVRNMRKKNCTDSKFDGEKNSTVQLLMNSTFDGMSSGRQWFYQTCNEFGYFQTTDSVHSPFHPLALVNQNNIANEICRRVFNISVNPDIERTKTNYGALDINVANVTFPSGTIDPWHVLGIQNSTELALDSSIPVFIEGTSHCADMSAPKDNDTSALKWARKRISHSIRKLLYRKHNEVESAMDQ